MILTVDAKRRVTLPKDLISARPGDHFEASFDPEEDALTFRRLPPKKDWLAVLKECPVPLDDLPPRSREMPKKVRL